MKGPFQDILLDEISLEGLDGITLEALWTRLSERLDIPKPFSLKIKTTFWTIINTFDCVDFYELPEARPDLVLYNRYNNVDPDLGVILEPENPPQDVYPYHPIDDVNKGIRGSCQHYYARKNITSDVKDMNLQDVENEWGSKLILVASQTERYYSLIGAYHLPCKSIPIIRYCLLERIGRSRYHGEITQGKVSLQVIDKDSKSLSYHCKKLFNMKLTAKQLCYQKTNTCNNSGRLIHLPRFYVEKKPKSVVLTEKVIEFLKLKKNCCATYEELKKELGPKRKGLKKLLKTAEMQRILKTDLRVFYRELFPHATVSEWKRKGCDKERTIQCVQLINPDININSIWDSDETFDDDNENVYLNTKNQLIDRSIISQAYTFIEKSENEGLSQQEIGFKLGRNKLQARSVCRKLARDGQITSYMANSGRQRVTRFVAIQHYDKISELHSELNKIIKENETAEHSSDRQESNPLKRKLDPDEVDDVRNSKKIRVDEDSEADSLDQKTNEGVSFSEANLNQITTKISLIKSDHGFSKDVKVSLSLDEMKSHGVTYRLGKRANFIIKSVKSLKVIQDVVRVLKMIITDERKERHPSQICKKSLTRLLMKLSYHGFLKLYKADIASPTQKISLTFVCDRDVEEDHQIIKSAIEQVKLKLCSLIIPVDAKNPKVPTFPTFDVKKVPKSLLDYDVNAGKKYGVAPKFMRMRLLHQFLFYLVYEHDRTIKVEHEHVLEKFENRDFEIDDEIRSLLSSVYNADELDKMFVPPLPPHKDYPKGWFLVCDILLRMPLSLFVQLVNITYRVPGIEKYLEHPIKKHFLIKHLPSKIRSILLYARKYIFKIHEVMQNLCFIGLVQFGAQRFKDKEQVFVYLNKRTTVVDTTSSELGYHHVSDKEYSSKSYEFCSQRDVERYWYEVVNVCTNTNLGTRRTVMGKQIELESTYVKPALMAALKSKRGDEAVEQDDGSVPGDHKGAAGFDSALFSHLLRNWQHVLTNKEAVATATNSTKTVSTKVKRTVSKIKNVSVTKNPFMHKRVVEKKKAKQEEFKLLKSHKSTPGVGRKILRRVPNAKKKKRRPYYDESDISALKQMSKLRVDWSATEDHVLLLCKVALLTVYSDVRAPDRKFVYIRDTIRRVLHSYNKTSRACQRRVNYMMKNPSTENSVRLCYEETKRIPEVQALMRLKSGTNQPIIFIELFRILYKKFRDINISDQFVESDLSDSMEKFFNSYNIHLLSDLNKDTIYDEPSDEIGIHQTVITSVIHSSMCSSKDKINWSYHMLYIYQKYPNFLLKNTLTRVRRMQMIAVKKRFSKKKLNNANNTWPLGANAFYLSCYYNNKFLTKYPYSVYQECFRNLSYFTEKIYNEDTVRDFGVKVVPSTGGVAAAVIELYLNFDLDFNIEIPEQVIILDPNFSAEDAAFKRIKKHFQDIFESVQNNMAISSVSLSDDEDDKLDDDDNLASLDEKESPSSQQKTVVNEDKITRSTRLALYMMREEQTTAVSESANTQHMHDFFLVNSSKVYIDVPNAKEKLSLSLISNKKDLLEQVVRESQIPLKTFTDKEVDDRLNAIWSLEAELKLVKDVIEFVKGKGSLGVTINGIKESYNQTACETLFDILCKLVETKILIKCGVYHVTYVHQSKAKCWYIESFKLKRLDREKIDSSAKDERIKEITDDKQTVDSEKTAEEREEAIVSTSGVLEDSETVGVEKPTEIISKETTVEKDASEPMEVCQEISDESTVGTNAVIENTTKPMEIDSIFNSEQFKSTEDSITKDANVGNEKDNSEAMVICQDTEDTVDQVTEPSGDEVTSTDQTDKIDTIAGNVPPANRSSVKFIPAPWLRVDGTLNRKVLDRYLGTLLNHCMCQPGISVDKLCKYFVYLKHVEVFSLVQYLVKLGCVKLIKVKKAKVTLFSKPSEIEIVPSVGFEDFNEILVEPIYNCLSKLSIFIGVPEYTVEFP